MKTKPTDTNIKKSVTYTKIFTLFLIGSIAGVIIEGIFCLINKGHWETHVVSVLAPYNILYGLGAVLFYVGSIKLRKKPLAAQVVIMTSLATTLELLCGLLLRYGLQMRAWDYSNSFLNYKGIICLNFSIAWGIAALAFAIFSSRINRLLNHCTAKPWRMTCSVLCLVMVLDLGMTAGSILRWSERHYGIPAQTDIQKELDIEAPDNWMQHRFIEWKFLDQK